MPQPTNHSNQDPTQMETARYVLDIIQRLMFCDNNQENVTRDPLQIEHTFSDDMAPVITKKFEQDLRELTRLGYHPDNIIPDTDHTFQLGRGYEFHNEQLVSDLQEGHEIPELDWDWEDAFRSAENTNQVHSLGNDDRDVNRSVQLRGNVDVQPAETTTTTTAEDTALSPEMPARPEDLEAMFEMPQAEPEDPPALPEEPPIIFADPLTVLGDPVARPLEPPAPQVLSRCPNMEPTWGKYAPLRQILSREERIPLGELVGPKHTKYSSATLERVKKGTLKKLQPAVWEPPVFKSTGLPRAEWVNREELGQGEIRGKTRWWVYFPIRLDNEDGGEDEKVSEEFVSDLSGSDVSDEQESGE